jgi:hypothetical protein
VRRQVPLEGFCRLLGLKFLEEGEDGVQYYNRDDGNRERKRPAYDGQGGGRPEQECQRVGKLAGELPEAAGALPPLDLVRAVLLEAAGSLPFG